MAFGAFWGVFMGRALCNLRGDRKKQGQEEFDHAWRTKPMRANPQWIGANT
jgi:hypothetical protein